MHKLIPDLYNRYNKTLRPLVSEIEGRNEYFEEPLLLDITALPDYQQAYEDYSEIEKMVDRELPLDL